MTTVFDDGADVLFEAWPEIVQADFFPLTGEPVEGVRVNVTQSIQNLPVGYDAQAWGDVVQIEYILADVGREARQDDQFRIDAETVYRVVDVVENDGRFVRVVAR